MKVSVIIPCYNEEEVLPLSHKRFSQVMGSTAHDYELIFVNDGSKDHTEELLLGFANDDPHTKVISFSRNFGHQNAVSAGYTTVPETLPLSSTWTCKTRPKLFPK